MAANKDVMLHAAVTIVPRKNGLLLVGNLDKDIELCQFAAELMAKKLPYKESHIRRAFDEMRDACIERMRSAGMLKL